MQLKIPRTDLTVREKIRHVLYARNIFAKTLYKVTQSAFHLYGKTGDNFPQDGTVSMVKTVVPLWNQMERYFPLVIWGNKPRISTKSMVASVTESNGSVIFRSFPGKHGKRALRRPEAIPIFRKISSVKDCSICCPTTRTTGFSKQMESAHNKTIQIQNKVNCK